MALRRDAVAMFATAVLAASCDQGEPTNTREEGPPLRLIGASVGVGRPLPANGDVELVFDRLILPVTATRQSVAIVDGEGGQGLPAVGYDPLRRRITLANPEHDGKAWLTPGQPYRVVLGIADGEAILGGLRAIDGEKIRKDSPRQVGFIAAPSTPREAPLAADYCRDVAPVLAAKCVSCHGGERTEAGLDLSNAEGIRATAIDHIAHASIRSGSVTLPSNPDRHFGSDMAIIDRESPGTSYLVYKVLVDPVSDAPSTSTCGVLAARPSWSLPEDERLRLRDRISAHGVATPLLSRDETSVIADWIAAGASLATCENCAPK